MARKLRTSDLFSAMRMINKTGIRDEVVRLANDANKKAFNEREAGVELVLNVIANCGDEGAEKAIYAFLSGVLEHTPAELAEMELDEFTSELIEAIEINREILVDFFKQAAALAKKR